MTGVHREGGAGAVRGGTRQEGQPLEKQAGQLVVSGPFGAGGHELPAVPWLSVAWASAAPATQRAVWRTGCREAQDCTAVSRSSMYFCAHSSFPITSFPRAQSSPEGTCPGVTGKSQAPASPQSPSHHDLLACCRDWRGRHRLRSLLHPPWSAPVL